MFIVVFISISINLFIDSFSIHESTFVTTQLSMFKLSLREFNKIAESYRCIERAKDFNLNEDARIQAVYRLAKLKTRFVVPELINLMGKATDQFTLSIVYTLGEIGDARALPRLQGVVEKSFLPGVASTTFHNSIEKILKAQK